MKIEEMRALLQQSLKPKRYEHSVRVYETALKMAERYHADVKKVAVAALIFSLTVLINIVLKFVLFVLYHLFFGC